MASLFLTSLSSRARSEVGLRARVPLWGVSEPFGFSSLTFLGLGRLSLGFSFLFVLTDCAHFLFCLNCSSIRDIAKQVTVLKHTPPPQAIYTWLMLKQGFSSCRTKLSSKIRFLTIRRPHIVLPLKIVIVTHGL